MAGGPDELARLAGFPPVSHADFRHARPAPAGVFPFDEALNRPAPGRHGARGSFRAGHRRLPNCRTAELLPEHPFSPGQRLRFSDQLPRSEVGKVLQRVLRDGFPVGGGVNPSPP